MVGRRPRPSNFRSALYKRGCRTSSLFIAIYRRYILGRVSTSVSRPERVFPTMSASSASKAASSADAELHPEVQLRVFTPPPQRPGLATSSKAPVLLFVSGGAWVGGPLSRLTIAPFNDKIARRLAAQGVVVVMATVQHRGFTDLFCMEIMMVALAALTVCTGRMALGLASLTALGTLFARRATGTRPREASDPDWDEQTSSAWRWTMARAESLGGDGSKVALAGVSLLSSAQLSSAQLSALVTGFAKPCECGATLLR